MSDTIHAQAIRFIREIVQAKKKATKKDVEKFIELLREVKAPLDNVEQLKKDLDKNLENRIEYFQKKQNKTKEEEYKKVRLLMSKFFEFYLKKMV